MPRPLQSLPSPAAGVETAQVAVPLSHLRPNTSQCRRRFSNWPLEASFTLRARDLPVSLSSSATRDPASSTRAPPKTAFDAELSSQAKSLCAARARSWMQDSDTPVCPGLLVEHATTHPWALARWRQGTDLLISDLPTVPCRHPPHEIRQCKPPHVSSLHMGPWTLKKVPLPARFKRAFSGFDPPISRRRECLGIPLVSQIG